jgi:hypothetical protein
MNDEISTILDDCKEREERLSDWERTFVDSLKRQLGEGKKLSTKQITTITDIWDRITTTGHARR